MDGGGACALTVTQPFVAVVYEAESGAVLAAARVARPEVLLPEYEEMVARRERGEAHEGEAHVFFRHASRLRCARSGAPSQG